MQASRVMGQGFGDAHGCTSMIPVVWFVSSRK
jgi:hypothetical protein